MTFFVAKATEHMRYEGLSYEGCPLILRDFSVEPVPTKWLLHMWDGSSEHTVWAYAYSLKKWLAWLTFRRIDWWRATCDDLIRYKRLMQRERANASINVALAAICSFHKWCYQQGFTALQPFDLLSAKRAGSLSSVPLVKSHRIFKRVPRTHTREQFDDILASSPRADKGVQFRDELIGELGRFSGLRRMEIAALTLDQLSAAELVGSFYVVELTKTKGDRQRKIVVPEALIRRIKRYVSIYRANVLARRQNKRTMSKPPNAVFLTVNATPIRPQYITATWATASKAAGVQSHFHNNRHTFITSVVNASKRAGAHPYRLAQDLAGHASDRTTKNYVHSPLVEHDDCWSIEIIEEALNAKP